MLTINLFQTDRPPLFVQPHVVPAILATIGGRVVECGHAMHLGNSLIYISARKGESEVAGMWLDDGSTVQPLTFRIQNGPHRDTGWIESPICPYGCEEIAADVRRLMTHGLVRVVRQGEAALQLSA